MEEAKGERVKETLRKGSEEKGERMDAQGAGAGDGARK